MKICRAFIGLLLLFVAAVVASAGSHADEAAADLLSRESDQLRLQGRYSEAIQKAQQAVEVAKAAGLAEQKPWIYGAYLHQLGALHVQTNDFEQALLPLKGALEIRQRSDSDALPETSGTLGRLYQDMGRFSEAEALLGETATLYEKKFGLSNDPIDRARLANAESNLGVLYRELGKYELAKDRLTKALQLRELLPESMKKTFIANSKFQLAALYRDQGSNRTAEPLAREAVQLWEAAQENQQSIASGLLLHADILRGEGKLEEAEVQAKRGLEIRKKEFGQESLRVASGLNVLGVVLESRERLGEAETAYREVLRIRTALLSSDHPDLATSKARLGALLKSQGKLAEAEELLESALAIREKKLGPEHPDTVKSLDTLGDLMRRTKRPERARELFGRADKHRKSSVHQIRILFGTNRQEESGSDQQLQFGRVESKNQTLVVGLAEVLVPDVRAGRRTAAARSEAVPLSALERPQAEEVTSADHMNIREIWKKPAGELVAISRARLTESQIYSGKALVFLHGFNTSFSNALVRAAQLAYDLEFDGPVLLFSWPSKGGESTWDHVKNIFNYTPDRTSAANARLPLAQFLKQVPLVSERPKLAFIAHSMGNRLLLETLRDAARSPQDAIGENVGDLILAAPDVPRSEFKTFMGEIRHLGGLKTLYAARNDRALSASRSFWGEAPAGLIEESAKWWQFWKTASASEPTIALGVETIDVSAAGRSGALDFLSINHDIYATNLSLMEDMRIVIQNSEHPPHQRNGRSFLKRPSADGDYWVFEPAVE